MKFFLKETLYTTIFLVSLVPQLSAFCARCEQIEQERVLEQKEHPEKAGYYDEHRISSFDETKSSNQQPSSSGNSGADVKDSKPTPSTAHCNL